MELDGRHPAVIRVLEADPAVGEFVDRSWALVESQVAAYVARGYSALDVHFGCTGGRHRSVYSAEWTARRLRERFPTARVAVRHREQPAVASSGHAMPVASSPRTAAVASGAST